MSKRRRNRPNFDKTTSGSEADSGEQWRPIWLGCVTALLVATPLLPSEAAPSGGSVSLLMAWFALFAAFATTSAFQRNLRLRIGATDIAFVVFIALHTVSAILLADTGQPRQTLNMLWQWVGFGVAFFLIRQVVRTAHESRALVAVMIAFAVCLSMHGYYQYCYSMPQARREFEADHEGLLVKQGVVPPKDSPERKPFEDRLYSTEPIATFTLANSLAGFLAPWLFCAGALAALNWSRRELRRPLMISAGLSVFLVSGCFLLTKSRSATFALLAACGFLFVDAWKSGVRPGWKLMLGVVGSLGLLVLGTVLAGGLDLEVLTEAILSFGFRLQYWQASLAMIADAPWLGCGPGNFQQAYTAYKFPEASETISDPHNLVMEVWATAGTPAMVAFMGILLCFAYQLRRCISDASRKSADSDSEDQGCVRAIYWGALAGVQFGFVAALVAGTVVNYLPDVALFVVGLPVAVGIVIAWHPWVLHGRLPIVVLVLSIVLLLVNLLAAGGISFAGVALTLWSLLAIALNVPRQPKSDPLASGKVGLALSATSVVIAFLFWYSTFAPVLNVSTKLAQASALQQQRRPTESEQALLAAAAADSYSFRPWQALAHQRLQAWLPEESNSPEPSSAEAAFEVAAHELLRLHPRSSAIHRAYGDWYFRAYRAKGESRLLKEATNAYRRAVELYPNYNFGHAQLSWALKLSGESEASIAHANEALRLDALNPHQEQKLARQSIFDPLSTVESEAPHPSQVDAEQFMNWLRSSPGG